VGTLGVLGNNVGVRGYIISEDTLGIYNIIYRNKENKMMDGRVYIEGEVDEYTIPVTYPIWDPTAVRYGLPVMTFEAAVNIYRVGLYTLLYVRLLRSAT
jgi:hypothetical protein